MFEENEKLNVEKTSFRYRKNIRKFVYTETFFRLVSKV